MKVCVCARVCAGMYMCINHWLWYNKRCVCVCTHKCVCLVWLYLAVSFHSASSPSLRQISSSSVKSAWGMCSSSSSSIPNKNCTLWDGVSAVDGKKGHRKREGERKGVKKKDFKRQYVKLFVLCRTHTRSHTYCTREIPGRPQFLSLSPLTSSCDGVHGDDVACATSDRVAHAPQCTEYGGLQQTNTADEKKMYVIAIQGSKFK